MGFVIIVVMSLYLLITIVVVKLAIRHARKHGKSAKRWGWSAVLIMYLIPFWDWIPTLENLLNRLSDLFGVSGGATSGNRDSLYTQIEAIEGSTLFQVTAGFTSIVPVSSLSNAAMDDTVDGYAYRYALLNLNSFAITGNAGLYLSSEWDADNFSEQYLTDRAYLLNQLLSRNIQDSEIIPATDGRLEYFDDRASNTAVATFLTALGIPDNAIRYSFGDENADTINGGTQGDRLYGGAENFRSPWCKEWMRGYTRRAHPTWLNRYGALLRGKQKSRFGPAARSKKVA